MHLFNQEQQLRAHAFEAIQLAPDGREVLLGTFLVSTRHGADLAYDAAETLCEEARNKPRRPAAFVREINAPDEGSAAERFTLSLTRAQLDELKLLGNSAKVDLGVAIAFFCGSRLGILREVLATVQAATIQPAGNEYEEVREFARARGIVLLDSEDRRTARTRVAGLLEIEESEVSDAAIEAALDGIDASKSSIPLVTETEEGENAVQDAVREALVATGLLAEPGEDEEG